MGREGNNVSGTLPFYRIYVATTSKAVDERDVDRKDWKSVGKRRRAEKGEGEGKDWKR